VRPEQAQSQVVLMILLPAVAAQNVAYARSGAALGLVRRFHDPGWNATHPAAIVAARIQAESTTR
jgi:hypothetical protein